MSIPSQTVFQHPARTPSHQYRQAVNTAHSERHRRSVRCHCRVDRNQYVQERCSDSRTASSPLRQVECLKAKSLQHLVVRALRDGQLARGLPQSLSIRWTMRRVSVSVVMLAALLGMYWPDVAWIALFNTATVAVARHIRQ